VTLEVHLPELIGSIVFEPLEGSMLERLFGIHPAMTEKNLVDGAGTWQTADPEVEETSAQLASAPGRVLIA